VYILFGRGDYRGDATKEYRQKRLRNKTVFKMWKYLVV
jgi:hypothetical protein